MTAQTCTHRDLARELGVSETTIKSYRSKFPTFLPVAREGKPVRLHSEALPVCLRIRDLFAQGLSIVQAAQVLKAEFKEYPLNRRLSNRQEPRAGGGLAAPGDSVETDRPDALAARIEALTNGQEQARVRMEQLEAEVRNLATLEAASKALVAELVAELRAARAVVPPGANTSGQGSAQTAAAGSGASPMAAPVNSSAANHSATARADAPDMARRVVDAAARASSPAAPPTSARADAGAEADSRATVLTARKIVTVHGAAGPVASYALGREPAPAPPFPEPETPSPVFMALPAVIRSDRGDFLGLPGGQSVRRLVEVLSPDGAASVTWFAEGAEAWTCAIPLGRAQNREILFERTTTPRGNLVGLIRRMRINEAEATPVQLQEIFRQLRDQMA
ncbi:MerR family transcriptional regulator [Humidesulfovibrio idahonensis]